MPVTGCYHCGAPNHHSGESIRVTCHECDQSVIIPTRDRVFDR